MEVFIKYDIIQSANEYCPRLLFARRSDVVVIRKIVNSNSFYVSHPSRTDNSFYVNRNEIMFDDPIITHNDKISYLKGVNFKSLDERYTQ
jgi:hypothetical protein